MCRSCWVEEGAPMELPDGWEAIVADIDELYAQPDGASGGPLHVELDDFNVDLDWEPTPGYGRKTTEAAARIAKAMTELTGDERRAVIAKKWGWF